MPSEESPERPSPLSTKALRAIIDASPFGILVFDESEKVIYANQPSEELFGNRFEQGVSDFRCGDFILCSNRHTAPRGCGHTPSCPACSFSATVRSALAGNLEASPLSLLQKLYEPFFTTKEPGSASRFFTASSCRTTGTSKSRANPTGGPLLSSGCPANHNSLLKNPLFAGRGRMLRCKACEIPRNEQPLHAGCSEEGCVKPS